MRNDSILLKTAKEEISRFEKAPLAHFEPLAFFKTDLWHNLARLYSAAILQISQKPPASIEIAGFPDLNIIRKLPARFKPSHAAIKEYLKLSGFIVNRYESAR